MLAWLWGGMLVLGVAIAAGTGRGGAVTQAAIDASNGAVELLLGFAGVLVFWTGLARVAMKAGMVDGLARAVRPFLRPLFPSIPGDHPALGTIVMNLAANVLGLGSAATPLGLQAMKEMQTLNRGDPRTATDAMCTFLALNTSSVTLVPTTVIAIRAGAGSLDPAAVVGTTILATLASSAAAVLADCWARTAGARRGR